MEARPLVGLDRPSLSQFVHAKCGDHDLDDSNIDGSLITSIKKRSILSNGKTKKVKSLNGDIPPSEGLSRTILLSNGKRKRRKRVNNFIGCKEDENVEGCASRLGSSSGGNVDARTIHNHSQKRKRARTDDKSSSIRIDASKKYSVMKMFSFPSPTNSNLGSPRSKPVKTEVGKRLIKASKNLGNSAYKKRLSVSLSKFKKGKLLSPTTASVAKYLVFEISDRDD